MKKVVTSYEIQVIPEAEENEFRERLQVIQDDIDMYNKRILSDFTKYGDASGKEIIDIKYKKYYLEDVQRDAYEIKVYIANVNYCNEETFERHSKGILQIIK